MDKEQHDIIIYSTPDGKTSVSLMTRDGKVWLNQSQISDLFGTSVQNISYHIINILKDKELDENSVIKDYLITASDGKKYNVIYYSLEMILAIGYRVRSIRGVQFRQWATRHLSEYLIKGFTMDDDRLKNSDGRQRPQASRRSPRGSICKCDVLCICHNVACMGFLLSK